MSHASTPSDASPLIRFESVRKCFGPHTVLDDLSLDIAPAERLCLIGPSGSGKSTILRLLMTLEQPTAGRVLVDGQTLWPDFAGRPRRLTREERQRQAQLRLTIGMVFQQFNLFPHLSVGENLMLAPRLVRGLSREESRNSAKALLDRVGLSEKWDAFPGALSGGQKQRVAIARALALEPQVMLFDEATSALDPELVGEVIAVIQDLARTSAMAMLFVTHQLHFVERIADRVLVLDGGRIVESGPPAQVLSTPTHPTTKAFLAALEM